MCDSNGPAPAPGRNANAGVREMRRLLLAVAFVMAFSSNGYAQSVKDDATIKRYGSYASPDKFVFQGYRWRFFPTSGAGGDIIKNNPTDRKFANLVADYIYKRTGRKCNIEHITIRQIFQLSSLARIRRESFGEKVKLNGKLYDVGVIAGKWAHIISLYECDKVFGTYYVACRDKCNRRWDDWKVLWRDSKGSWRFK